jgi:hypothetical protein
MAARFIEEILKSKELDITDNVCDLTALFKDIKVLQKGGLLKRSR